MAEYDVEVLNPENSHWQDDLTNEQIDEVERLECELREELIEQRKAVILPNFAVGEGDIIDLQRAQDMDQIEGQLPGSGRYLVPIQLEEAHLPATFLDLIRRSDEEHIASYLQQLAEQQPLPEWDPAQQWLQLVRETADPPWLSLSNQFLQIHTRSKAAQTGLEVIDLLWSSAEPEQFYALVELHAEVTYPLRSEDELACVYSQEGTEKIVGTSLSDLVQNGTPNGTDKVFTRESDSDILFLDGEEAAVADKQEAGRLALRLGPEIWQVGNGVDDSAINMLGPDAIPSALVREHYLNSGVHSEIAPESLEAGHNQERFWIGRTAAEVHLPDHMHLLLERDVYYLDDQGQLIKVASHLNSQLIHGTGTNGWHIRTETFSTDEGIAEMIQSGRLYVVARVYRDGE